MFYKSLWIEYLLNSSSKERLDWCSKIKCDKLSTQGASSSSRCSSSCIIPWITSRSSSVIGVKISFVDIYRSTCVKVDVGSHGAVVDNTATIL